MTQRPTSIRLSDHAEALRDALALKLGVSKSAVVEIALRLLAKRESRTWDNVRAPRDVPTK